VDSDYARSAWMRVIVLWYWRESKQIASGWGIFLALLRGVAFVLMITMLLRPSIEYTWIEGELSRLRIVIDTSASMQLHDEPSMSNPSELVSRIDRVKQGLLNESNGRENLLARLARYHKIELLNLQGKVLVGLNQSNGIISLSELNADNSRSPIGEMILASLREGIPGSQQNQNEKINAPHQNQSLWMP
jgi:hypothetical protein